jgi:membrane protease YdiL (CAAX protease family)
MALDKIYGERMDIENTTPAAYPNLKQSWGLLGITVLLAIGFNLILLAIGEFLAKVEGQSLGVAFSSSSITFLISYIIIFGLVVLIGSNYKKKWEGGFSPNLSLPSMPNLIFIVLGTLGIYFLVEPIVDFIPMPEFVKQVFIQMLGKLDVWKVIAVVIAAPIFEETILRGIMLDGLLKWYSPKKAIIWSSIFFGILHLNPWQFVPALFLGLFMGWIYYRTGSLLTTIIIHFVANGSGSLLALILMPDADALASTRDLFSNPLHYVMLLAVCLVVTATAIFYLNKNLKKMDSNM